MKKKSLRKQLAAMALCVFSLSMLCGCGDIVGAGSPNIPYEKDTPAPAPHNGVFVSDHGTMTFNGDGESVVIDFDDVLAGALGFPTGEQQANYMFYSGLMSPGGYVPIRYDSAMNIQITVGEGESAVSPMIPIGVENNGSFSTGTDCTTADRITMFVDIDGDDKWDAVNFLLKQ